MSGTLEPWDNAYQLDGETERLLRRLLVGPLTDDQIVRFCLKEVDLLLNPEEKEKIKSKMIDGASELLCADLQPFSEAIAGWEHKSEQFQNELNWSDVPPHLRKLSRRRAEHILQYGTENGWIEPADNKSEWRITEKGRSLIKRGGFYMR
jgi:hypothetical protein